MSERLSGRMNGRKPSDKTNEHEGWTTVSGNLSRIQSVILLYANILSLPTPGIPILL
jgi:hypothetical protein